LKQDWPADKLAAAFEKLQLAPQIRAEKVTLEQFVQLTNFLHGATGPKVANESGSKIG